MDTLTPGSRARLPFICECSTPTAWRWSKCRFRRLPISTRTGRGFCCAQATRLPGSEDVVGQHDGYVIVEKRHGDLSGKRLRP